MAQVWQCDRCDKISKNGDVDDPPEAWVNRGLPCRQPRLNRADRSRRRHVI